MIPIFKHPFSLIIAAPSNSGKSTLAFNIIRHSAELVSNTDNGFDSIWIIYQSNQPLYQELRRELNIPVFLFENSLPSDLETQLETARPFSQKSRYPMIVIDDGITMVNQQLVRDLFCRLGHHLSVSVILLCQTLFDSQNPTLRICHRNTKALIVFGCPRDQGSLRNLVHQMIPDRRKARALLEAIDSELRIPYNYMLFDFHPECPADQRYKTNILGERGPYPICFV